MRLCDRRRLKPRVRTRRRWAAQRMRRQMLSGAFAGSRSIASRPLLEVLPAFVVDGDRRMMVLRTAGVPSETTMPFAGLGRLLRPHLQRIVDLPGPQRDARSVRRRRERSSCACSAESPMTTRCASRPARGEATRPGQRASRSSSSARPTSARIRAKTSMASATGGLTSGPVRAVDRLGRTAGRRSTSKP
jgi:hypothetical protein